MLDDRCGTKYSHNASQRLSLSSYTMMPQLGVPSAHDQCKMRQQPRATSTAFQSLSPVHTRTGHGQLTVPTLPFCIGLVFSQVFLGSTHPTIDSTVANMLHSFSHFSSYLPSFAVVNHSNDLYNKKVSKLLPNHLFVVSCLCCSVTVAHIYSYNARMLYKGIRQFHLAIHT